MVENKQFINTMKIEFIDNMYWLTICCPDGKVACLNIGTSKLDTVTNCLKQVIKNGLYMASKDVFELINSGVN